MSSYGVCPTFDDTKKEIFNQGRVTGVLKVYEDFLTYSSDVYQHLTGAAEGDHAIKCIG
jgi:hypothetical protein